MRWPALLIPLIPLALLASIAAADRPNPAPPADIDRLIATLSFEDPDIRESAARQLIEMGRAARPRVLAAAQGAADPQIRAAAQELILKLPWAAPEDPPTVAAILANYGQPQVFHRVAAVRGLAANLPRDATPALLRLVREDPSDEIRWLIVTTFRKTLGRSALPTIDRIDTATRRAPNLALAAWAWEPRDYPKAVKLYWEVIDLEARQPTLEHKDGDADFVFDAVVAIELWNKRPDRAAHALRIQYARRPGSIDVGDEVSNKLFDLFALHANHGPVEGFIDDVRANAPALGQPQALYAIGRMYQRRSRRPLLADALYRAAFAANLTPSSADRAPVSEFLTNQHWNDLAEAELNTIAAVEGDSGTVEYANAHLRLGLIHARRGDDALAGRHKEMAMLSLQAAGGNVRRQKGDRRVEGEPAAQQLWAEIHWHYFKAARASGHAAEMDNRVAELLKLLPDDEHVVLDVAPALIEQGRTADAARLFVKPYAALKQELDDKPDDPERLNSLAWLCARCNQRLEEADQLIARALAAKPDNYAYLDTAAEVKFRLGHTVEAIRLEEKALSLKPGDDFIQSQLKRFREARR